MLFFLTVTSEAGHGANAAAVCEGQPGECQGGFGVSAQVTQILFLTEKLIFIDKKKSIWNRVYFDRSKLDLSDGTIRIKYFHFSHTCPPHLAQVWGASVTEIEIFHSDGSIGNI